MQMHPETTDKPIAVHRSVSLSDLSSSTPDELRDYRERCRRFIAEHGRTGWAYERELELLFAINRRLREIGDIALDED